MTRGRQTEAEGRITGQMVVKIINPGAIILSALMPALLGVLLSVADRGPVSPLLAAAVVAIAVCMNASIDLLNDYYDYVSGNDAPDTTASETEAPLAYNRIQNPRPIFWLGLGFLALAALLGVYVVWQAGWVPACIGAVGAIIVLTYSGGPLPLSHLPVGELVAGFTMGGLITLGVYTSLTGDLNWRVLYQGIPMMLVVSHFMLMNNTCDMERDRAAGRRTLPILLGRRRTRWVCVALTVFWVLQLLHVVLLFFPKGILVTVAVLLLCGKALLGMCAGGRTQDDKEQAVGPVALSSLGITVGYLLTIVVHLLRT